MNKLLFDIQRKIIFYEPQRFPEIISSLIYTSKYNLKRYKTNIEGWLSLPEVSLLHKIAKSLPNRSKVLEIGCYGGFSTAVILDALKESNSILYSIDPFDYDMDRQKKEIDSTKNIISKELGLEYFIYKPSMESVSKLLKSYGFQNFRLIQDYSYKVSKKWKHKLDMLWIDGNHDYPEVKRDYLDWSPFLKKGGVIVFHDANKLNKSNYWHWGLHGPTRVAREYIKKPKWININRVDSIVYAKKNQ